LIFNNIELQTRLSHPKPVYIPSPSILNELPFPHPNLLMTSTFGSAYTVSLSTTIEETLDIAEEEPFDD
jgi:hypothetical protein